MKKRNPIDFAIVAVLVIGVFFIVKTVESKQGTIDTKQATQQWNTLTHAQKETWLNNYIVNPDEEGLRLVSKMDKAIKSQLKSPPVLNYDHNPRFNIARVVEADSGFIEIENSGTLKSSSGIRETFSYLCILRITSVKKELVDVLVDIND